MRRIITLFLFALLLALPSTARADSPAYHTVAWGETLYSIARATGVSPQSLAAANGLTLNSWVYAGQVLKVPGAGGPSAPAPAQTTPSGIYTVRAGDTLIGIAQQFGVSVNALAAANNMPWNGFVYTGWQLKIPGGGSAPASSNTGTTPTTANSTSAYIVQPGDTLFAIAVRNGVSIQSIALLNNLRTYFVYSGQRLVIPGSGGAPASPPAAVPANPGNSALNVRVSGIPVYKQQQTLTCEEASAAMALRGAVSEAQILAVMPRSDNPFKGIRGSTNYPVYGGLSNYGTYAQGLQLGLSALGRASTVLYGQAFGDFKNTVISNLRAGRAVVWWTTWRQSYQSPQWVRTADGTSVKMVPYEHSVVLIAANDGGVTYADPYDATTRSASWANFQRVSGYFDNMALVIQ